MKHFGPKRITANQPVERMVTALLPGKCANGWPPPSLTLARSTFMDTHPKITQIPFRGGSGNVPTGAIQFQDDWPGLFLRGDSAISLLASIRGLQGRLSDHPDRVVRAVLLQLNQIAEIIQRDVVVGGEPPTLRPLT